MNGTTHVPEMWDAVIVGAGPAGSVSAAILAERGGKVLVLEKRAWPREKACGGCVNAGGVRMLGEAGLARALEGGVSVERLVVRLGVRRMEVAIPHGVAVNRRVFDGRLMEEACARGATFVDRSNARIVPRINKRWREVEWEFEGTMQRVRAKIVLACDGIQGSSLREEAWARWETAADAPIGVSTTAVDRKFAWGTIGMCVGEGGYVGLVRQDAETVHVGAALHAEACAQEGGAAGVVRKILGECGIEMEWSGKWVGVGPMTRKREVAGAGILAVGDACGYVEPFTGEGIAWAIRGACAVAELLGKRGAAWSEELAVEWRQAHAEEVASRQGWCRMIQQIARRPMAAAACMRVAEWFPGVPRRVAERIGA